MTNAQYQVRLLGLLFVYAALLVISLTAFAHGAVPKIFAVPMSLLPMVPAFGMLLLIMARYRSMDELQQRIQAEGIMFGFGATAILTFSYGFLENTAGAPQLSYFWIWAIMGAAWLTGTGLAWLRYR